MFRYIAALILIAGLSASCSPGDVSSSRDISFSQDRPFSQPSETESTKLITTGAAISGPNILLITVDTLRADRLGSYGNTRINTPNLDSLAAEGVRFNQAIVQFSQTNPSHASFLTGTYATTHKLKVHGIDKVEPTVITLAEVLARQGYNTGAVYSWPSLDPESSGFDRGFRSYQAAYFPIPGKENEHLWRKMAGRADVTTDTALSWLSGASSDPFFLWVHYQDPHYPFTPPAPFDTMYDPDCPNCLDGGYGTIDMVANGESISERDIDHLIALYDGAISFTDREIGRLLEGLRRAGIEDNTLIIVTGDHGESFGENGVWLHPYILYNTTLRVPLVMRYPPSMPPGTVIDSVVQSVDVMPTILELLNLPQPQQIDGASLWPLILGYENGDDRVAFAQVPDDTIIAMVTRRWKLIRDNRDGGIGLYDLQRDPKELNNLAWADAALTDELEQRLMAWMRSRGIKPEQ